MHWEKIHTTIMSHEVLVAAPLPSPDSPSLAQPATLPPDMPRPFPRGAPSSVRGPASHTLQGGFFLRWRSLLKPPHLTPLLKGAAGSL